MTIKDYLKDLESNRKLRIEEIIKLIKNHYPDVIEATDYSPKWNYPTFRIGDKYVAIASMKNYISIHFSNPQGPQIVAKADKRIKPQTGCVNIPDSVELPINELTEAIIATFNN